MFAFAAIQYQRNRYDYNSTSSKVSPIPIATMLFVGAFLNEVIIITASTLQDIQYLGIPITNLRLMLYLYIDYEFY